MNDNDLYKSIKEVEKVDVIDVVKAYAILYHAQVNNSYDVYLFLASINLLNNSFNFLIILNIISSLSSYYLKYN